MILSQILRKYLPLATVPFKRPHCYSLGLAVAAATTAAYYDRHYKYPYLAFCEREKNHDVLTSISPCEHESVLQHHYSHPAKISTAEVRLIPNNAESTKQKLLQEKQNLQSPVLETSSYHEDSLDNASPSDSDLSWMLEPRQTNSICIEQINANTEIEDRVVVHPIYTPNNGTLHIAAVIDGHGGWQIAEFIQRKLPGYVQREIQQNTKDNITPLTEVELGAALIRAFDQLDDTIMKNLKGTCDMKFSRTAKIGACCVAVLVTPDWLITANTGDCRAVLARNSTAIPLSSPHNANVPSERKKLKSQHPDESDAVVCKRSYEVHRTPKSWIDFPIYWVGLLGKEIEHAGCYVKGRLQPTRSFGDYYLKSKEFAYDFESKRPFVQNAKSFPYITASPEIKLLRRDKKRDGFLVLASDGVWDFLTPERVVNEAEKVWRESFQKCASSVIEATLQKAADEAGLKVKEITSLPAGQRRRVYDDTTVCIVNLSSF